MKKLDLTGQRFGRLVVLKEICGQKRVSWLCQCDCGKQCIVRRDNLRSGKTKSCGCYMMQRISESHKKQNDYIVSGETTILFTKNNDKILIDTNDFDKVKSFCWVVGNHGYACARNPTTKKVMTMHRFLLGLNQQTPIVDHANRNKLDNRRENLRTCTDSQNAANKNPSIVNKTGIIGINKQGNKWRARIQYQRQKYQLGFFDNFEDALRSRLDAEIKIFGEFAPQKNLIERMIENVV